jgi:hypothetical protein
VGLFGEFGGEKDGTDRQHRDFPFIQKDHVRRPLPDWA